MKTEFGPTAVVPAFKSASADLAFSSEKAEGEKNEKGSTGEEKPVIRSLGVGWSS